MAIPVRFISCITMIPPGSVEHIVPPEPASADGSEESVSLMGVSTLAENYFVARGRQYPWHVLLLIRKGELLYHDGLQETPYRHLPAGTLLFLPAGFEYAYGAEAELELTWFHLEPSATVWQFLEGVQRFFGEAGESRYLTDLVLLLFREKVLSRTADTTIGYYIRRLIERLLIKKMACFTNEPEKSRRLRNLFSEIELSLNKKWSVAQMAKACHVSQTELFILSKRCFHASPKEHLQKLRLASAANLLISTSFKLDTIAGMTGFGSGFALSRAFSRHFGVSCRQCRDSGHAPVTGK